MPDPSPNVAALDPAQLAERCGQRDAENTHEAFCFELFRRAILQLADWQECWTHIVATYERQVKVWIRQKISGLDQKQLHALAADTFARFFRQFNQNKLTQAQNGMASVMFFLRLCANSEAVDVLRGQQRRPEDAMPDEKLDLISDGEGNTPEDEAERSRLQSLFWRRVEKLARNERERVVVELNLSGGLKPGQIYASRPDLFKSAADVSEVKRALFERLVRDGEIQDLYRNRPGAR